MRLKYTFIFLLVVSTSNHLIAQQEFPHDVPSPNATSLGKYGDIPVSFYTGQANVSIPLYTMNVKGIEMPININYDTRGVQMNTLPGWTGENWTLETGGVIVRSVKGRADELIFPTRIIEAARRNSGNLHFPIPESYFQCHDTINTYFNNENLTADSLFSHILFSSFDLEPDLFTFNFMGHVGKFYLGNDGQWKVDCEENIDVIFDLEQSSNYAYPFIQKYPAFDDTNHNGADAYQPKTIYGFKLRDDNGFIYEFGYDTDAIEYTTPFFCASKLEDEWSWIANSWYLTKVSDKFGNTLYDLKYRRGCFVTQIYNEEGWHYWNALTHTFWGNAGMTGGSESPSHDFPYGLQLNAPVYLNTIQTASGIEVQFNSAIAPELSMSNLYYNFCHDANMGTNQNLQLHCNKYSHTTSGTPIEQPFYYLQNENFSNYHANRRSAEYSNFDYSNTAQLLARTGLEKLSYITIIPSRTTGLSYSQYKKFLFFYDYDKRMHLTKIKETHGPEDSFYSRYYQFKYQDYDKLPEDYLTRKVDHWGYYNGREYECPNSWDNVDNYYSQREPDSVCMKYGILKKIIYPTGGATVFDYEPNDYSSVLNRNRQGCDSSNGIGCGLRIKAISDYNDTTCTTLLKKRTYEYLDDATGLSSGQLFATPIYHWLDWHAKAQFDLTVSTFRTSSIVPLSNSFGPSIGYSHVVEKQIDGSKTVWEYANYSDMYDDLLTDSRFNTSAISPYDRFCERGYSRGKIKSVQYFDPSHQKVKSTGYIYRTDLSDNNLINNYSILAANLATERMGGYYYTGRFYRIYFPKNDIIESRDTIFQQNGNAITRIEYQRSEHTINMYDGHKILTRVLDRTKETRFGSEGKLNTLTTINYYPQLSSHNTLSKLATQLFDLKPVATAEYHNSGFIKCDSIIFSSNFVKGDTLLPKYYITRYPTSIDTTAIALGYNQNNKSLEEYKDATGQITRLFWGKDGCYLACVAKLPFASSATFPLTFIDNVLFSPTAMKEYATNKIRELPNVMMSFYSYHPLYGLTSKTDSDLTTTYFEYDIFSRLISIMDNNQNFLNKFQYSYKIQP